MASQEVEQLVETIRINSLTVEGWDAAHAACEELDRSVTEDDLAFLREVLDVCDREQGELASTICLILTRLGTTTDIPLVVRALGRPFGRDFYRDAVRESLPFLVEQAPEVAAPIVGELIAHAPPWQRSEAIELYPYVRHLLPLALIRSALQDPDDGVRESAIRALSASLDVPEAWQGFADALASSDEYVVTTAIEALAHSENPNALPLLQPLLDHASRRVQECALNAVVRLEGHTNNE